MKRSRPRDGTAAEKRLWKPSVLGRYWLFQLPGTLLLGLVLLVLEELFSVSLSTIGLVLGIWIAKDVLLYPWLWRSYDANYPGSHSMEGAEGVAAGRLDPTGHARVRGELWRAELVEGHAPIEAGEAVRVETARDFTLVVRRASE